MHQVVEREHTDGLLSGDHRDYNSLEVRVLCLWLGSILDCKDCWIVCCAMVHLFWVVEFGIPNSESPFWIIAPLRFLMEYSRRILCFRASFTSTDKSYLFIHKIKSWEINPPNLLLDHFLGAFCNSPPFGWVACSCCFNARHNSKKQCWYSSKYVYLWNILFLKNKLPFEQNKQKLVSARISFYHCVEHFYLLNF